MSVYTRRQTVSVHVGNTAIGGSNPIRLQSMTTVSTMDTEGCIDQAIRIINAGGELVRMTTQGTREAENMRLIREGLTARGFASHSLIMTVPIYWARNSIMNTTQD